MKPKFTPLTNTERDRLKALAATLPNHRRVPAGTLPRRPDRQARSESNEYDALKDRAIQQKMAEESVDYATAANAVTFELQRATFAAASSTPPPAQPTGAKPVGQFPAKPRETAWDRLRREQKLIGPNGDGGNAA